MILEGIGNGFWHNNMSCKMNYCLNMMYGQQAGHEIKISRISFNESCLFWNSPTVAGIKIVDHDYIATCID